MSDKVNINHFTRSGAPDGVAAEACQKLCNAAMAKFTLEQVAGKAFDSGIALQENGFDNLSVAAVARSNDAALGTG